MHRGQRDWDRVIEDTCEREVHHIGMSFTASQSVEAQRKEQHDGGVISCENGSHEDILLILKAIMRLSATAGLSVSKLYCCSLEHCSLSSDSRPNVRRQDCLL